MAASSGRYDCSGTLPHSRAETCGFITLDDGSSSEGSLCMLPFPDDLHTVASDSSRTGRRVAFEDAAMPKNVLGTPIASADYNLNDALSPEQPTVANVPALDTPEARAATDPDPSSFMVAPMWVAHSRWQVSTRWPNGQRSQ